MRLVLAEVCKLNRVICHGDWRRHKNTGKQHMQEDGVTKLLPQKARLYFRQFDFFPLLFFSLWSFNVSIFKKEKCQEMKMQG